MPKDMSGDFVILCLERLQDLYGLHGYLQLKERAREITLEATDILSKPISEARKTDQPGSFHWAVR